MNKSLIELFERHFGQTPTHIESLGGSASNRLYFRLFYGDGQSVIGVVGENRRENHAFLRLAHTMHRAGIRVPEVWAASDDEMCYLQQDLGRDSLYDHIARCQKEGSWDRQTLSLLRQVMLDLPHIQLEGAKGFDFQQEASREKSINLDNVNWDLYYFKYCFLKPSGLVFDENRLEACFAALRTNLLQVPSQGLFLYRDFQSRNVMVKDGKPYYIDFQGGYEGPYYYDVASFLWQARANYPKDLRRELLQTYRRELQSLIPLPDDFEEQLLQFVLFRLLQVLGAYGFRGLFERKVAFISPIVQALQLLRELLDEHAALKSQYAYLYELVMELLSLDRFQPQASKGTLTVHIKSFSFKKGIPDDNSGNGGGFVFDCRAPHNPGRYAEYKKITGLQQPVIDFLENNAPAMISYLGEERYQQIASEKLGTELTMPQFMEHVYGIVVPAVETYLKRGFTSLCVNFGCTGGQHRSVYGAQHLAEHLKALHPDLRVELIHREQGIRQDL